MSKRALKPRMNVADLNPDVLKLITDKLNDVDFMAFAETFLADISVHRFKEHVLLHFNTDIRKQIAIEKLEAYTRYYQELMQHNPSDSEEMQYADYNLIIKRYEAMIRLLGGQAGSGRKASTPKKALMSKK